MARGEPLGPSAFLMPQKRQCGPPPGGAPRSGGEQWELLRPSRLLTGRVSRFMGRRVRITGSVSTTKIVDVFVSQLSHPERLALVVD